MSTLRGLYHFDRHKDNFGYLVKKGEAIKNAPIYDCGSCLYPDLAEERFQDVLSNVDEVKLRIYQFPKIALNKNPNKNREDKFGYFELLSSNFDKECTKALFRIYDRIDMNKINSIIDNTPFISDVRKNFYKQMLSYRKELILDRSYEILIGLPEIQNNKDYYFPNQAETAISKSHIQPQQNALNTEKTLNIKDRQSLDARLKQVHETRDSQPPQEHPHSKSNGHDDR